MWITGEKDATIQNFKGMLELNPGDNQGIRYILAAKLLEIGKMDDLKSLLDKCADEHSDLSRRRFISKMELLMRVTSTNPIASQMRNATE